MISRFDETRGGLSAVIRAAFAAAAAKGLLPEAEPAPYVVEIPADPKNGDFSTNAAMVNARVLRCAPQKIAAALLEWPRKRWKRAPSTAAATTAKMKR